MKVSVAVFASVLLVVPAVSCTPDVASDGVPAQARPSSSGAAVGHEQGRKTRKITGRSRARSDRKERWTRAAARSPETPTEEQSSGSVSTAADGKGALATASSAVLDPVPDAMRNGAPPSYAEIAAATVRGMGDDLELAVTLAGDLPMRMPNEDTNTIIAVKMRTTDDSEFVLGAHASEQGWKPFAKWYGHKRPFPGRLKISGGTLTMTIPWSFMDGPRRFKWFANASWIQSAGVIPIYSIDVAPSVEGHPYPR